ncbi:MAG TPA: NADPH-dependent FMN reductase [Jiangellaceae bacterium]|nr:NADPH-dependent FMN reductase [Jiangellaceae bacterium]
MTDRIARVLAIPGSLRRESYNRSLVAAAASLTPPDMSFTVYESLDTIPVFNEDLENPPPPGVARLREAVASSDGLLIATPEYNQSMPGVVKNVIDWLSRTDGPEGLSGKPVAVTGVTSGPWGTRLAQTQVRQVLTSTQALVLSQPTLFLRDATTLFDQDRNLVHEPTSRRLHEFLVSFGLWIRLVSPRFVQP